MLLEPQVGLHPKVRESITGPREKLLLNSGIRQQTAPRALQPCTLQGRLEEGSNGIETPHITTLGRGNGI